MKRIGKWFGSSILIVASIIMLLSILSCKQKGKTPDNNKNKTTEKFKIEFEVSPANTATLKAMEGTTPVNSGDKVEKGKTVVFSLDVKDKGYVFEKWETKSELTKKTATGAELVVTEMQKL